MSGIIRDIRNAVRILSKSPMLSATVIVSLALGIGATVTVYSWASGLLFRPIAGVSDQSNLVILDGQTRQGAGIRLSYPNFVDVRERVTTFQDMIAFSTQAMNLAAVDQSDRVWGQLVTGNFFAFLHLQPAAGRFFTTDEDRKPGASPVVVISFDFWQRRFNAEPSVIGREIRINKHPFTIVGVAPRGFYSAYPTLIVDLWIPIMMQAQVSPGGDRLSLRDSYWLLAFGRLRENVGLSEARAEVDAISTQLTHEHYRTNDGHVMKVLALWDAPGGVAFLRPLITTLSGVAVLLLALACSNVGGILLVQAIHRRKEVAIKTSLGASRLRIIRQLLIENSILALLSGAIGTLFGYWSAGLLIAFFPPSGLPGGFHVVVDWRWIAFAFALSGFTSLAFGFAPALDISKANLTCVLKDESAGVTGSSRTSRVRKGLLLAQVAISFVLLLTAGLFIRTLHEAGRAKVGFNPKGVLLASIDVFGAGYSMDSGRAFFHQLLDRIDSAPGVHASTFARRIALNVGAQYRSVVRIDGYVPSENEDVVLTLNYVGPRYLETLQIPLIEGRDFTPADREDAPDVGIINETAASRYWKTNPIGQVVRLGERSVTIVGVASDSKYDNLAEPPTPYLYVSAFQFYQPSMVLHIRTVGDPGSFAAPLREIVRRMDPSVTLFDVRTMTEHMAVSTFLYRLAATCLVIVGSIALILASGGLYSMTAYNVSRRTSEIGLRMALGANRRQIVFMVLRQTMTWTAVGLCVGIGIFVAMAPMLNAMLLGVDPADPLVVVTTPLLLLMVCAIASFVPIRRAISVDPSACLRSR